MHTYKHKGPQISSKGQSIDPVECERVAVLLMIHLCAYIHTCMRAYIDITKTQVAALYDSPLDRGRVVVWLSIYIRAYTYIHSYILTYIHT